jgi:hypothetical protein
MHDTETFIQALTLILVTAVLVIIGLMFLELRLFDYINPDNRKNTDYIEAHYANIIEVDDAADYKISFTTKDGTVVKKSINKSVYSIKENIKISKPSINKKKNILLVPSYMWKESN